MASDATDSHRGMVIDMESYRTENTARMAEVMPIATAAGRAGNATEPTNNTPDRSLPLSDEEMRRLFRICQERERGFMVSGPDVDFLLALIERMSR